MHQSQCHIGSFYIVERLGLWSGRGLVLMLVLGQCATDVLCQCADTLIGTVAVSWLKIVAANPNANPTILSHETATLPINYHHP